MAAKLGAPLDAAGRLVSFAFMAATLCPLSMLMRVCGLGRPAFLFTAILFLTAPQYLYWGRTFLIETCALFFCVLFLALLARYLRDRRISILFGVVLAGALAALSKATTFPAFAFIGGCLILLDIAAQVRSGKGAVPTLRSMALPAVALALPLAPAYAWVVYTDQIKELNEIGRLLMSTSLTDWNYGAWSQRFSSNLWIATISNRSLPDLFGVALPVAIVALGATLTERRLLVATILAGAGFLLPFLLFTNLHIVHNYYQTANGLFAVAAVGFGLASVSRQDGFAYRYIATVLLAGIVASQMWWFDKAFRPHLAEETASNRVFQASLFVRNNTPENGSVVVFGDDWASTVPYYARRKGIAAPNWIPSPYIERLTSNPQSLLGDQPLAAVVLCRGARYKPESPDDAARIEAFVGARERVADFGGCEVYGDIKSN